MDAVHLLLLCFAAFHLSHASDNCKSNAIIGLAKYSKYTDIVVHDISGPRKRKYFCDLCDDEELCCLPIFTNKSTGYVTYKDKKGIDRKKLLFDDRPDCKCSDPPPCKCSGQSDVHYSTFDSKWIHYQGMCKYLLAGNVGVNGLPVFEVYGQNAPWYGSPFYSYTLYVEVKYCGQVIKLGPGLTYTVISPPSGTPDLNCFTISSTAGSIWITTDFGLKVEFKPWHTFYITVPGCFRDLLTGICGDCNGNSADDLNKRDGSSTTGTDQQRWTAVGDSYLVQSCRSKMRPTMRPKMDTRNPRDVNSDQFCGLLNNYDDDNPFMDCLEQLGSDVVEGLYESCVIDIRATENEDDQKDVACDMLKMLIRECMAVGICIDPKWTDLSGCPECPSHLKNREEALKSNNADCQLWPDKILEDYVFCEDTCTKPQYACQLKETAGWIHKECRDGERRVIPYTFPGDSPDFQPCTCECRESRWTQWMLWNQPPSSLCTVDKVDIWKDQDYYYLCSGACEDKQDCDGRGNAVATRVLTCEGVDSQIKQRLYTEGVKCYCG